MTHQLDLFCAPQADAAPALLSAVGRELGGDVGRAFALMSIAEEEIAAATKRHPGFDADSAFMVVCPPAGMSRLDKRVYRSHCRELLERMAAGEKTEPATDSECLVGALAAATVCPLGQIGGALTTRLFLSVFGELPPGVDDNEREPWPGAVDEELAKMRRRLGAKRGTNA